MNTAATAPTFSNPRFVVAGTLRTLCRLEQTEAYLFGTLCEEGRHEAELVDEVINEMLDAGELYPSMVQHEGRTYPTLRAI